MPVDFEEAHSLISQYGDIYRARHDAFRSLRKYWHGDYWAMADYEQSRPITSIFRDLTAHLSDVGPEIKLVHNVIQQVCVKYQTFLAPLPQIRVWTDPPETDTRRAQATRKERYLYGCWAAGRMSAIFRRAGWYLPLMGDCFLGVHPNFDKSLPTPIVRGPEFAYPIPGFDKNSERAICFKWRVAESEAARSYPAYADALSAAPVTTGKDRSPLEKRVEIVEYSDDKEFHRWIVNIGVRNKKEQILGEPIEVNGVEHNLGFNLFEHVKFIDVPDEIWGHGAVEQAINLNEMGNALYSLLFQSVIENVFPRLVLIDPAKAPEEIETGPGAVIPINQGGGVEWLHPPVQAIGMQRDFAAMNDANIKDITGMPPVQFGSTEGMGSIITGAAINELQGAGTGSTLEMVQGGFGEAVSSWNEKAIAIGQSLFRDDTMHLFGAEYKSSMDIVPERFAFNMKGKELVGSPRNDVIFSPAINPHEKLVMWLQAKGGGLVSDEFIRNQIGISDNEAMVDQMLVEAINQAVLGAMLGEMQQAPDPQTASKVETEAFAFLQGKTAKGVQQSGMLPAPQAHPLLALAAGPQQGGGAPPQGAAPPAQGAPPPGGQPAPQQQTGTVSLSEAIAAFGQLQGLAGRVFLVGEIVVRQQTSRTIEVAVTDPADRQTIANGLPQYAGKLTFHVVPDQPSEPFVEVTPGSPPRRGGSEQASPEALNRVFVS